MSPVPVNDVGLGTFEKPDLFGYFFGLQIVICIEILDILSRGKRKASVSCAVAAAIGTGFKSDTWSETAEEPQDFRRSDPSSITMISILG